MRALIRNPFQRFFAQEAGGGIVLLACAVVALAWVNSPWSAIYETLWSVKANVGVGRFGIDKSLLLWVNDGLMAVFFLVVGLEIKRELVVGELADPRRAALPVAGALGGLLLPAAIYLAFTVGTPDSRGWAVPIATDIAFALGVLALLGDRVPIGLKIFLTALAIIDDLAAVLVIALFYTAEVSTPALLTAGAVLIALVILNRAGVSHPLPYLGLGLVLWVAILKSGVHATIAGVLLAATIPAHRRVDVSTFAEHSRDLLDGLQRSIEPGQIAPTSAQRDVIEEIELSAQAVESPLRRLEHALHPWVAFAVMPVFALANAGVGLEREAIALLSAPVALGTAVGLTVGKPVGVLIGAWFAVRSGVAGLPTGVGWRHMAGAGFLCGIGFTMSLFIATLAFDPAGLQMAKIGVIAASLISGATGWMVLRRAPRTSAR